MVMKRNVLVDLEQIDAILEKNDCLLYGAGKVARIIVRYASKKGYRINGILVTDALDNPDSVLGVPVYALNEYPGNLEDQCLIVAAMENIHEELDKEILNFNIEKKYFVSNELYQKVVYHTGDYEIDILEQFKVLRRDMVDKENALLRFVPRPCLEYLVLNIVDHCNLRCKGCDHFACIADPYCVPYETIHRDLERLSEIFHGDYVMKLAVMGGEPLLHPELLRILADVRLYFPHTIIRLSTNGLLLLKQDEEFWRVCRENDVTIVNTRYPINLDYDKMRGKAKEENVKFQYFEGTDDQHVRKICKKVINLKGDKNPVENFANCYISNYGNFLMEGKLYGCPFACQSYRIFNKKFHAGLRMTEKDYLDIYKVQDMQEIFDFAASPKYYCRYCDGRSPFFDWTRSSQKIDEWIEDEE